MNRNNFLLSTISAGLLTAFTFKTNNPLSIKQVEEHYHHPHSYEDIIPNKLKGSAYVAYYASIIAEYNQQANNTYTIVKNRFGSHLTDLTLNDLNEYVRNNNTNIPDMITTTPTPYTFIHYRCKDGFANNGPFSQLAVAYFTPENLKRVQYTMKRREELSASLRTLKHI